jgi:hypothetical protein
MAEIYEDAISQCKSLSFWVNPKLFVLFRLGKLTANRVHMEATSVKDVSTLYPTLSAAIS